MPILDLNSPYFAVGISIMLSLLPALIWAAIFLHKTHEKRYMLVRTFMLGAVMVIPLVIYRQLWDAFPSIDLVERLKPLDYYADFAFNISLSVIALFVTIGVIEEVLKMLVVSKVDAKEIHSVSDAIEFSVVAALGFSFAENTFYFIEIYQNLGAEALLNVALFRSLFSMFAHILFSSVYGYHMGLAKFAGPIYQEMSNKSLVKKALRLVQKVTTFKASDVFEDQQKFVGLFYAASLHAIFNILLDIGNTMFLFPFLIIGVIHVSILLWNKENHVEYSK
jgi:RsiW-degrading membrane proteinase PrsW (M82 family)